MFKLGQVDHGHGFPARLAVLGDDIGENAAAHIELGGQAHEARLGGCHQVIQNAVGDGFVKGALVAEGPDIELETLQFDTGLIRNIVQIERGEVRLAGFRAQAGEFRDFHVNMEIAAGLRVVEGFEHLAGLTGHEGYRINRLNKQNYTT